MPGRTLVALGGHDQLLHVEGVLEGTATCAAKVLYHPDHSHSQWLLDAGWQQQVGRCVLTGMYISG